MSSTDLNRRAFLRGRRSQFDSNAIRPPWTIEASKFIEKCDRCDECINACPERIIIKGEGGYPEIDFKRGECTFCTDCVDACRSKAFTVDSTSKNYQKNSLEPENAWRLSVTIMPSCLSLNAIVCRTCGDNCDENAIRFKLQVGGVSIPLVDAEECTGCGQCLYICPKKSILIKNKE